MSNTQPNRAAFDLLPSGGYVRQADLIPAVVPFSGATLWRKVKAGTFPAPVKLSERVTAWRVEDVRAWLNSPKSA
ncbi:AlpA family transcriptional regulator [Sulfuritortus calidifontis]|uniref:AlpA family transcriptional regulator n=1 Tax=Sulfuritortus calidifontis TaxID=1914471 RepID=A0A4R3JWU0_9PROT|nr:AlpA family phage regulatory protein [Sulfuritortus calidifontis]TCS72689.1 AlpA family transcriptional regulator [Sulfuritortus calidifontis]